MRTLLTFLILCLLGTHLTAVPVFAQEPDVAPQECGDGEQRVSTQRPDGTTQVSCIPSTIRLTAGSDGTAAQPQFVPLVGLPSLTDSSETRSLAGYLNILFRLAIGLGALLAVIKIVVAGIKYMSSDAFASKEDAKSDITNSLLGLLLILSTFVLIRLINPDILELNILQQLDPVQVNVLDLSGPCPTGANTSLTTNTCATPAERRAFLKACEDSGGKIGSVPQEPGLIECVGGRTSTHASGEAVLDEFKERYPQASDAQRRNFIQNVVNHIPEDADAVLEAWRASDPAYQDEALEIVYVVEMSDDPTPLGTTINGQQAAVCRDWNPAAASGIIEGPFQHNGKRYQVCGFVQ